MKKTKVVAKPGKKKNASRVVAKTEKKKSGVVAKTEKKIKVGW